MSNLSTQSGSFPTVRVMLVDLDPIFRLGLKTCLEASPDFCVVSEVGRTSEILQRLDALTDKDLTTGVNPYPIDVLVWAVDVRHAGQPITLGLPQLMRSRYPGLPLCVLLGQNDSWLLRELWQGAVEGCWLKNANQVALLAAIRQIASGQKVWDARLLSQLDSESLSTEILSPASSKMGLMIQGLRQRLGDRSLQELEQGLAELDQSLVSAGLGVWERVVLEGRFREMQAARRLIQVWVLPRAVIRDQSIPWPTQRDVERKIPATESVTWEAPSSPRSVALVASGEQLSSEVFSAPSPDMAVVTENQFQTYKGALIESIIAKLSQGLPNLTSEPLEIDILNPAKRQELLFIILRLIEETIDDLRFSQVSLVQLTQQRSQILVELWQRATADFFGKYVMLPTANQAEVPLVLRLLEAQSAVNSMILTKIPLIESLLAHLIFQTPLLVNNQAAPMGSPDAMRQAEALLENWMVRVANAVVAPLLNQFGSVEVVKQAFYDRRWITTREIERFRNSLSWKYRMAQLFGEPRHIFESQVPVLVLTPAGIRSQEVYLPRDEELQRLSGIPLLVTLALEARDAIAPPLRASFTWVGRGVVYVLTQVVGRGIGLIGRGVLQGIGTAWQETRDNRKPISRDSDSA